MVTGDWLWMVLYLKELYYLDVHSIAVQIFRKACHTFVIIQADIKFMLTQS